MQFLSTTSQVCLLVSFSSFTFVSTALTTPENSYLVYAILKYKQRFEAVREFTLESGQQEIERQQERWKAGTASNDTLASPTLSQPEDDLHLPSGARSPLTQIPEENSAFAIGEDDSDDEGQHTPSQSSPSAQTSRRPSIASTTDETSSQLRGMSEKARGKKPAGQPSFSRQNSMTSQTSMSALFLSSSMAFTPTVGWVSLGVALVAVLSFYLFLLTFLIIARVLASGTSPTHHSHHHFRYRAPYPRCSTSDYIQSRGPYFDHQSSVIC